MELPSHCPLFLLPFAEWTRKDGGRTWGPKVQRRLGLITSQFNIIIRMVCSCQGSVPALQACGGMSLTFPPEASLWHIKKKKWFLHRHTLRARTLFAPHSMASAQSRSCPKGAFFAWWTEGHWCLRIQPILGYWVGCMKMKKRGRFTPPQVAGVQVPRQESQPGGSILTPGWQSRMGPNHTAP